MPLFRLSDPALLPELVADLAARPDMVLEVVTEDTILVNILGCLQHRGPPHGNRAADSRLAGSSERPRRRR